MPLENVHVRGYRALADVEIDLGPINVFFGPNAAGKSSLLDVLWFVRDCAIRGVEEATAARDHGIGLLWDGDGNNDRFSIELRTARARYETRFRLGTGRIDPRAGEELTSTSGERLFVRRSAGQAKADFFLTKSGQLETLELREPERLALTRYLDLEENAPAEAGSVDGLLRRLSFYDARQLDFWRLRRLGSESSYQVRLSDRAGNLWSVLRNLHDRRSLDPRFETILDLMRSAFPKFKDLFLEQAGVSVVIGQFIEHGRGRPIKASGVSDGFLQLLILLTSLFSEEPEQASLVMLDEPETSLHPHAIATLAQAIEKATGGWGRQVMIATHSPVLLSQFDPDQVILVEPRDDGATTLRRVDEIEEIQDLMPEYALGSLFMAEAIGQQR